MRRSKGLSSLGSDEEFGFTNNTGGVTSPLGAVIVDDATEAWGEGRPPPPTTTTIPVTEISPPSPPPSITEVVKKEEEVKEEPKKKTTRPFNSWLSFTKPTPTTTDSPSSPPVPHHRSSNSFSSRFKASLTPHAKKPSLTTLPPGPPLRSNTQFTEVDIDTMVYLFQFLSISTLLKLKQASRRFQYLVSLDRVWAYRLKLIGYNQEWEQELSLGDQTTSSPESILHRIWLELRRPYLQFLLIHTEIDPYLSAFHVVRDKVEKEEEENKVEGEDGNKEKEIDCHRHPLSRMAKLIFRLGKVSKAKVIDEWSEVELNLTMMRCYFEASLLTNLNLAYIEMDLEDLKVQCTALQNLRGGKAGIQWLIEQNPIFTYQDYKAPEDVSDLDTVFDTLEQYFTAFYREMEAENKLLLKIFSDGTEGNTVFIEQIFRDCLTALVYPILNIAEEQSDMLPALYPEVIVKCLDLGIAMISQLKSSTISVDLTRVETAFFYFFRPILHLYVKNELLFLDLNYTTITKSFLYRTFGSLEASDQTPVSGFLGNIDHHRKRVMSSVSRAFANPTTMFKLALPKNTKTAPLEAVADYDDFDFGGSVLDELPEKSHSRSTSTTKPDQPDRAEEFNFSNYISVNLAQNMIDINTQSLKRLTKFQYFTKFPVCERLVKNTIENIFSRLTSYLGGQHISKAFDVAFRHLRAHQSAQFQTLSGELVGPVLSFFDLVKLADAVQNCLDGYYHRELKRYIDPDDFLDTCNIAKKRFEISIDEVVAEGLDLSIQTLMHHVHFLLQHYQLPADFKPGRPLDNLRPTPACQEVVNCLIAHVSLVRRSDLEPKMLEVFYSEIALRLFHDLCKHIKAFTIDEAGGYQLLSDLSGYFSWIITLDIPDVIPHFQALKEVANLFLLTPDNLKILLHDQERFLGIFHPEDLLEFVQRRVDYRKIQKVIEVEGCTVM